jgi:hypothetical protein
MQSGLEAALEDSLRAEINNLQIESSSQINPAARIGVILDYGHADVGSSTDSGLIEEVPTLETARKLLNDQRGRVLSDYLAEVTRIYSGINEERLIDAGDGQFFIAQIVASAGEDDTIIPIEGVAVWWHPQNPLALTPYSWCADDYWEDWFVEEYLPRSAQDQQDEIIMAFVKRMRRTSQKSEP